MRSNTPISNAISELKAIMRQFSDLQSMHVNSYLYTPTETYEKSLESEKQIFFGEIQKILHNDFHDLNSDVLQAFKEIFQQRWAVIAGTPISYVANRQYRVNQIFIELAWIIARHSNADFLQILMPSVSKYNQISTEEEKISPINLQQYILSDDNKILIDVKACLEDLEKRGGEQLFHTHLVDGELPKPLSAFEKEQIICHSFEAQQYYQAVMRLNRMSIKSSEEKSDPSQWNFYIFITNLIENLRKGSNRTNVRGTGQEYMPGPEAVDGVGVFYQFVEKLTPQEKQFLFNLSSPGRYKFQHYFELMFKPGTKQEYKHLNSETCVSILSNDFELIQQFNSAALLAKYPADKNGAKQIAMKTALLKVEQTRQDFFKVIDSANYQITFSYGYSAKQKLITNLKQYKLKNQFKNKSLMQCLEELKPEQQFSFISQVNREEILNNVKDIHALIKLFTILKNCTFPFHKEITREIIGKSYINFTKFLNSKLFSPHTVAMWLGAAQLRSLITSLTELKTILNLFRQAEEEKWILQTLGNYHISGLVLGSLRNKSYVPTANETFICSSFSNVAIATINAMLDIKIPQNFSKKNIISPINLSLSLPYEHQRYSIIPACHNLRIWRRPKPPIPNHIIRKEKLEKLLRKFLKDAALRIIEVTSNGLIVTSDKSSHSHHIELLRTKGVTAATVLPKMLTYQSRHLKIFSNVEDLIERLQIQQLQRVRPSL